MIIAGRDTLGKAPALRRGLSDPRVSASLASSNLRIHVGGPTASAGRARAQMPVRQFKLAEFTGTAPGQLAGAGVESDQLALGQLEVAAIRSACDSEPLNSSHSPSSGRPSGSSEAES